MLLSDYILDYCIRDVDVADFPNFVLNVLERLAR